MWRKAFLPLNYFTVFQYESQVWLCSSAPFYGKVSFPPLCLQQLPDTDKACRLLRSALYVCVCARVCVCKPVYVQNRHCCFGRATYGEVDLVMPCWSFFDETNSSSKPNECPADFPWIVFFFFYGCTMSHVLALILSVTVPDVEQPEVFVVVLYAMGCVFSLPENRRDAAERSVKCLITRLRQLSNVSAF